MKTTSVKTIYDQLHKKNHFDCCSKALGFKSVHDLQIDLKAKSVSHLINASHVEDVVEWLFSHGFDIVREVEDLNFPTSHPIDIVKFLMEQRDMNQDDLACILERSKSHISKILSRERPLTLKMVNTLSQYFHISSDLLIAKYECKG